MELQEMKPDGGVMAMQAKPSLLRVKRLAGDEAPEHISALPLSRAHRCMQAANGEAACIVSNMKNPAIRTCKRF